MHGIRLHPLLCVALSMSALACEPPEDEDPGEGSAPEASGIIHGAVLYSGPRPECVYDGETPSELIGNVVLLMFEFDNPPPPAGTASSASNVLVIPARELFGLEDCLPSAPTPDELRTVVTRSAQFDWPEIALAEGPGAGVDYQIRGFMDRDGDWLPFFGVTRLATHGDVAGGAFESTRTDPPQFARIRFGSRADFREGQVISGVAVTLGAFVNTELPAFRLGESTQAGLSENVVPPISDPLMQEQAIFAQTNMRLELIDPTSEAWARTLSTAGMRIAPDPSRFAWFTLDVDANRDGSQDPHPVLGSLGVPWEHPVVILRRARNPIELAAGIPDALLIATVRQSQTLTMDTFAPRIDIAVAPIAVVSWNPASEMCQIPMLAPGNLAESLEQVPVDCQELPTGNFDVNVLSGIAGGAAIDFRAQLAAERPELSPAEIDEMVRARTDNDWVIEGGSYSSQGWSIPNELGCPDPYRPNALDDNGSPTTFNQLEQDPRLGCGDPAGACDASGTSMQCDQGPAGRWSLVDANPSNAPDAASTTDGHGVEACERALRAATGMPDDVSYIPVPEVCCTDSVRALCGLPLCELRPVAILAGAGGSRDIREIREPGTDYAVDERGRVTPLCVPFLPPPFCCR